MSAPDTIPTYGEWVDTDPGYGFQYRTVEEVRWQKEAVDAEVDFDSIEVRTDGLVLLVCEGRYVARATLSDHHADARLVIGDVPAGTRAFQ